ERDTAFLEGVCERLRVRFFHGTFDVPALAREERLSLEAASRRARYAFLAATANREGYAAVATAHHAGDQRETVLFRLARGGREEGRAGILPAVRISGVEVVRPLLSVEPESLLAYAEERGLPFREDTTNENLRFTRNRLRRFVAPRVCHREIDALARLALVRRRLVEAAADRVLTRFPASGEAWRSSGFSLPVHTLRYIDGDLRREVLCRAYHHVAPASAPLGERTLDLLERLMHSPVGGMASLRGVLAHVSCGVLRLTPVMSRVRGRAATRVLDEASQTELFDPLALEGPLVLRPWRTGDRLEFTYGRKKVKEILRESRIPRWEREGRLVVADSRGPLWLVGVRRGSRGVPGNGGPALRVTIRRSSSTGEASLVTEVVTETPPVPGLHGEAV
nr:tRNA lysidine(34) synthetase TilS [Gemmatimonadota bacterium]